MAKYRYEKKSLKNSIKWAFNGLKENFQSEAHFRIELLCAILVTISGFIFKISYSEWFICIILIGNIMSAELLNTAIEKATNMVTEEESQKVKVIKDSASAGVFVAILISVVGGLMVFLPKIIALF